MRATRRQEGGIGADAAGRSDGAGNADRTGSWRLVARREFVERARDRGFLVSTLITLLILAGVIVGNAIFNRGTEFDLGLVGARSENVGNQVVAIARSQDVAIDLHRYPDQAAAEAVVRSGEVDAAVVGGRVVLVRSEPPEPLIQLVQAAVTTENARGILAGAGLPEQVIQRVLNPPPAGVRSVEPVDPHLGEKRTVAFVGMLLLYGQLFGYGYWVASGVVEEKASRVVELLLSTIRPWELLLGKIAGIGLLSLIQLFFFGAVAITLAIAVGALEFPAEALTTSVVVVAWFVVGFALFSTLFAVAGAVVSRQEELQNSASPMNLVILAALLISISSMSDPDGALARIGSLLPFSAPLVMPVRMATGDVSVWDALLSAGIALAATALLIPVGGRIYEGAVLRLGARVRLKEAWAARR